MNECEVCYFARPGPAALDFYWGQRFNRRVVKCRFLYGNLPCYVAVHCGLHYVRSKMFVRFSIAISALLFVLPSWAQPVKYGNPSILSQCLDPPSSSTGYGPSTRARECTRLYCAQPEYRALVEAYAMRRPQSEENQNRALICITRSEQDQQRK